MDVRLTVLIIVRTFLHYVDLAASPRADTQSLFVFLLFVLFFKETSVACVRPYSAASGSRPEERGLERGRIRETRAHLTKYSSRYLGKQKRDENKGLCTFFVSFRSESREEEKSLSLITVTSCYAREGRRVLNATSARALPPRLDDENDQYRVVGEKEYWM